MKLELSWQEKDYHKTMLLRAERKLLQSISDSKNPTLKKLHEKSLRINKGIQQELTK